MSGKAFGCWQCGRSTDVALFRMNRPGKPGIWACEEHRDRTKCAIDGCSRSCKRGPWEWVCSVHWRRYCPPRSLRRRAYLAFFRKAKRHGWTERLTAQHWRFWDTLTRAANAAESAGSIDIAEINKLFGWTDD